MRRICTGCLMIIGIAAGVILALAYRSSKDTGKGLVQSLKEMPAGARRRAEDVRTRAQQAVASGRQAAAEKELEIEAVMSGDQCAPAADGAYSGT